MRRRKRRKQRKIIIISSLTLLFIMTVGYAAFQTNINITAKGNILEKGITINELKAKVTTSGDGLYKDIYETNRYIYRGANPDNYILFNNETWRIISIETDNILKIMKKDSIGDKAFDSTGGTYGSNNWARPATLNTYLNENYYTTLSADAKKLIQKHAWGIGSVTYENTDLAAQIVSENKTIWNGNIGLISVSDFLRANTNVSKCDNYYSSNNTNLTTCKTTNYLVPTSGMYWTISPNAASSQYNMFDVHSNGGVYAFYANFDGDKVLPAVYLTSNITLKGQGTEIKPYIIN